MITLNLKINIDDIVDDVNDLFLSQIPFAAKLALSDTVFKTARDVRSIMPAFIQGGPVPFTKRGIQFTKPKSKRSLVATVFIPNDRWDYMQWVVDGGSKKWQKSKAGVSVPIYDNVRFNKYGNIPGKKRKERLWREILKRGSGRAASPVKGQISKKQFIATIGDITGVWQREGKGNRGKVKLIMKFTKEAIPYRKTFPFTKWVFKFGKRYFKSDFNKRLVSVVKREAGLLSVN